MRESVADKGRRYLVEGRVQLVEVVPDSIIATVRGGGETYRCGWWNGGWRCTCPARQGHCAHLEAMRLITVSPRAVERSA